jgi:ABC-type antimicrobial peptide transport system permease subunit
MRNLKKVFLHSIRMISVNLRSYFMLSITTFLSFVIILSFLFYVDTMSYNEHKMLFSFPDNVGQVIQTNFNNNEVNTLLKYISTIDNATISPWKATTVNLTSYSNEKVNILGEIYFMSYDQQMYPYFDGERFRSIDVTNGNNFSNIDVLIENDVVLVGSTFANRSESNIIGHVIKIPININDITVVKDFKVVGIFDDENENSLFYDEINDTYIMYSKIVMPYSHYTFFDSNNLINNFTIISNQIDDISNQAREINAGIVSITAAKKNAFFELYNNALNKGIILFVVFIILGLSAFSNTTNSLQSRSREIGTKLALGIEKRDIFKEFFIEALLVLLFNLALAILFVMSVASLILIWYRLVVDETFILYVSLESLLQFIVFTFFIVNISCAILANQAIRISALKHIRNE